jgi:hypothetical protein
VDGTWLRDLTSSPTIRGRRENDPCRTTDVASGYTCGGFNGGTIVSAIGYTATEGGDFRAVTLKFHGGTDVTIGSKTGAFEMTE